eukprot:CCRYP_016575-RA/>CCRYP_016575-RA protein AED:0.07 eAED:0.07 QI:150/1/1/1/0/0.5/2/253/348
MTRRPGSKRSTKQRIVVVITVCLVGLLFFQQIKNPSFLTNCRCKEEVAESAIQHEDIVKFITHNELDALTKELLGPDEFGSGCPNGCGCPQTRVDCPRHYNISTVERSAKALLDNKAIRYYEAKLEMAHISAAQACLEKGKSSTTGGWCLRSYRRGNEIELPDGRKISIPQHHVPASKNIVSVLLNFFRDEHVTSVSDYGAGVGQYGVEFKTKMPELIYHGYDGAGDVEPYTLGLLKWFDLTQVLNNPVTDWVLSLEVGEHIPSKYEGMFVRNLHRHNCRGIILSWAILGQNGNMHINNHSNDYLTAVFGELGYERDNVLETSLRNATDNYFWFEQSVMVFRRNEPIC